MLFETRWTLSYLCGPLTRDQIRKLKPAVAAESSSPAPTGPVAAAEVREGPPVLEKVIQIFSAQQASGQWTARLLVSAAVRYRDAKRGIDSSHEVALLLPCRVP